MAFVVCKNTFFTLFYISCKK